MNRQLAFAHGAIALQIRTSALLYSTLQIPCQQRFALFFLPDCCCRAAPKICHSGTKRLWVVGVKLFLMAKSCHPPALPQ